MTSNEFWEEQFKDREEANDFSSHLIYKNEYDIHSEHGWTLDHILPLNMNGPDTWGNIQITHWKTNEEKPELIHLQQMASDSKLKGLKIFLMMKKWRIILTKDVINSIV